jgi:hypothetical protein
MRRPVGVKSILFSLRGTSFSPAEWPLSPCFHPHSQERIVSLGACWAFSVQPVLPSVYRPVVLLFKRGTRARRLTQSPELGFGLLSLFLERFDFGFAVLLYAAAATGTWLLLCNGWYTSPLTRR